MVNGHAGAATCTTMRTLLCMMVVVDASCVLVGRRPKRPVQLRDHATPITVRCIAIGLATIAATIPCNVDGSPAGITRAMRCVIENAEAQDPVAQKQFIQRISALQFRARYHTLALRHAYVQ